MTITVTQEDIDKGNTQGCTECPVEIALLRSFPDEMVGVGESGIWITGQHHETPPSVVDFIRLFDRRHPVQPFTFELA